MREFGFWVGRWRFLFLHSKRAYERWCVSAEHSWIDWSLATGIDSRHKMGFE